MARLTFASLLLSSLALAGACDTDPGSPGTGTTAVEGVPLSDTIASAAVRAPVDVVRDEWGIPHIYGANYPDVTFAQGYLMAQDRLIAMDLGRRLAQGTIAEVVGDQMESILDQDISMRMHHMRKTAEQTRQQLIASGDPADKELAAVLTSFVAGINAYIADLQAGKYSLPSGLVFIYTPAAVTNWDEADVLSLGLLQAFELAFDADSEIHRSQLDEAGALRFDNAADPARKARAKIAQDLQILAPIDPTHTISGWTGMNGDPTTAFAPTATGKKDSGNRFALLEADRKTVVDMGNDHIVHPSRGSNNWVVGPQLSKSGHAMVANDTHLGLSNPPTFYLNHLNVRGGQTTGNVMGVQFAGIPGVILGMNEHIAWGATVSNIDVTDVYEESITACDGGSNPCVMWKGTKVPLVPRVETFKQGSFGKVSKTRTITFYDVPHHGPIVPRITADHNIEALGTKELSVRYTGYEPAQTFRAIFGVDGAKDMREAVAALDRDFKYGGQNWVIGDDQGHIGWTETIRVPRRAKDHAPWKVLPGDGTAEWGPDMDPHYIPHAYDPAKGFIATANNDPIGVTDDNDPFFSEPTAPMGAESGPLYLGADYDAGTRVGRITKRIESATQSGGKLSLDDMQSIQADAVTEWAPHFQPLMIAAARALGEELAKPGTHPELSTMLSAADAADKANVVKVPGLLAGWSFDTPSAVAMESPSADQIRDSRATLLYAAWMSRFADAALGDEFKVLGQRVGSTAQRKLLAKMVNDPSLLATAISPVTHDSILFDNLDTPALVESKLQIAAAAMLDMLSYLRGQMGADPDKWRWGQLHTLTLEFPGGISALNLPPPDDATYKNGFPRHGDDGTVDIGSHGLSKTDFTYSEGPAIRFVCELGPDGPIGRNALPGGQTFDPSSPHFSDQLELWRKNQTFDLAFKDADVIKSAMKEYQMNKLGRVRFTPR